MKIKLKDIQYNESTISAKLFINAKHVAFISKSETAKGGYLYRPISEQGKDLIAAAEAYCKQLPPFYYPSRFGKPEQFVVADLASVINNDFIKFFDQKDALNFREIVDKKQEDAIVVGSREEGYFTIKLHAVISDLLRLPSGIIRLQHQLNDIYEELKERQLQDKLILNNNIPEAMLKKAGFKGEK